MSKITDEIDLKENMQNLQELGLSEKESRVYLALLSLGEVGASKIIKATGLHGQFVYDALNKLESKNLANHSIVRGRKKFISQNPDRLITFIEQKKQKAIATATSLNHLLTLPQNQQFEVYQGTESFIAHEFKTVKDAEPQSEMLVIGGVGDAYELALGKAFEEYEYWRIKKNIKVKYVGSEAQRESLQKRGEDRKQFSIKLLPGSFTGGVNMAIYGNKITFYMLGQPVVVFSLYNKKIADSYRQFFDMLWKIGK